MNILYNKMLSFYKTKIMKNVKYKIVIGNVNINYMERNYAGNIYFNFE